MTLIAAMTARRVIGKDGRMPWHIPEESKRFRKLTTGNVVVMGRKTFASIGGRPLRNRTNIVISRTLPTETDGVTVCRTLDEGLERAAAFGKEVFVMGGAEIYRQTLPRAGRMCLSLIKKDYDGDEYFPAFDENDWAVTRAEDHPDFVFTVYERKNVQGPASSVQSHNL